LTVVFYGSETHIEGKYRLNNIKQNRVRVFKNRVLRKTFGAKTDEATGEWRRLLNEDLYYLYSSSIIIQVIKSRIMRWVGHVPCMGDRRGAYRVLVGKPEGRDHLEDLGIDERIILK
jgi:hypothetical protein